MRTLLSRLAVLGAFALSVAGCAGSNGTALPNTGGTIGSGGGNGNQIGSATSPTGQGTVATPPPGVIAPLLIDDGTPNNYVWQGYNVASADKLNPGLNAPTDPQPAPPAAQLPVEPNGTGDAGSHQFLFSGNGQSQVIFKLIKTPASATGALNLTYTQTVGGNPNAVFASTYTYSAIVIHTFYQPSAVAPTLPAGATLSLELVGGSGPGAYDVRVPCGTPAVLAPTAVLTSASFTRFVCPIPTFGTDTSNLAVFPNAVTSGAKGAFLPTAANLYLVLNYPFATPPTAIPAPGTGGPNALGLDYVYAIQ